MKSRPKINICHNKKHWKHFLEVGKVDLKVVHWLGVATVAGISKFCPKSMRRFQFGGLYSKWVKYYSIKFIVFVKNGEIWYTHTPESRVCTSFSTFLPSSAKTVLLLPYSSI